MTEDDANRILDEIRALRHGQEAMRLGLEALRADMADIKISTNQPKISPGFAMSTVTFLQGQIFSQSVRIDRFEERMFRIERLIEKATLSVS
jgi:hypothetical protein